jgi:hypothetical protein
MPTAVATDLTGDGELAFDMEYVPFDLSEVDVGGPGTVTARLSGVLRQRGTIGDAQVSPSP